MCYGGRWANILYVHVAEVCWVFIEQRTVNGVAYRFQAIETFY